MLAILSIFVLALTLTLGLGVTIWFVLTVRSAVMLVSEKRRKFSPWLLWLFLIPIVNYFMAWFLLPFAIPKTLKAGSKSSRCKRVANQLVTMGLAIQILPIFLLFAWYNSQVTLVLSALAVGLLMAYWVIVYQLKQRFSSVIA